jgi:hypothetical protein
MASSHNSSQEVERLAEFYGEDVVAVEQNYPGIFIDSGPEDNFLGEADLLVRTDDGLKAYEVKESGSLNQRTLVSEAHEAREQLDNLETYLETLGYDVETEYLIVPEDHLQSVFEVWRDLPEIFTAEQIKDVLSEPGRFQHLKEEALNEKEEGIYEIEDSLRSVLDSEIVQP